MKESVVRDCGFKHDLGYQYMDQNHHVLVITLHLSTEYSQGLIVRKLLIVKKLASI